MDTGLLDRTEAQAQAPEVAAPNANALQELGSTVVGNTISVTDVSSLPINVTVEQVAAAGTPTVSVAERPTVVASSLNFGNDTEGLSHQQAKVVLNK
jgi:hypothetical protein